MPLNPEKPTKYSEKLIKLIGIIGGLTLVMLALTGGVASAHAVYQIGSIRALVHVDPLDSPVVGQPSTILFILSDSENRFEATHCNCRLTVTSEAGKTETLDADPLSTATSLSFRYSFPARSVYSVVLVAAPKSGQTFTPFKISFQQRVDRGVAPSSGDSGITILLAAGALMAALIGTSPMWYKFLNNTMRRSVYTHNSNLGSTKVD